MPALPRAHLVFVHPRLSFSSLKAGFNAGPRFDDPRQFRQPRLLQLRLGHPRRSEIIVVAIAGILIRGIPKDAGLHVRSSTRGRRGTPSHSSGPVRLRSRRVWTRRVTISISTGPFSPSRTVKCVHPAEPSDCRQPPTDCHGTFYHLSTPIYQNFSPICTTGS